MDEDSDHTPAQQEHEVTPLELFFDLVFVFAVSQLSHHLLMHLSWRGAAETLVLLRAVFAVWFITSWSATIIPASEPRTRGMMLSVMLLGLFMNAALTRAFTTSGWAFVVPLLLAQFGRTVWIRVNAPNAVYRDHYNRTLLWFAVTTPLWLAGAAVDPGGRLLWWALAAGIDLLGAWLAHPIPGRRLHSEDLPFDADHMLERCSLFLLIALGETVFTTGTAIATAPTTGMTLLTGAIALVGTVALWSLGFGHAVPVILRYVGQTRDPVRASRHAVDALMIMVAGLIAVAVGNEMVIAHPRGNPSPALSLLLAGGPVLFLAAQGGYLWAVPWVWPRLHIAAVAVLMVVGFVTLATPPYAALILIGASLAVVAVFDQRLDAIHGRKGRMEKQS